MNSLKDRPLISIVTPSFNQGEFLEETIDSVLSQGYPELEYVIIDGGSQDNSVEIIKKYERHLKYWVSEPDKGQSDAINKGLDHCTGDIFNWLNSDDYYEKGALSHVAQNFQSHECDIYGGVSRIFDAKGTKAMSPGSDVYPDSLSKSIGKARIDQPETFWNLSVLRNLLPINEKLHFLMDRDLWVRYLMRYGQDAIHKDSQLLVHFRHHSDSKTISNAESFERERNGYFFELAKYVNRDLTRISTLIDKSEVSLDISDFDIDDSDDHPFIDHFLFLIAQEFYAARKMKTFRLIIADIERTSLTDEDKKELRKLESRARLARYYWNN